MQKSLTCRSLRDCRINMYSFSFLFLLTNVLFLALGALLYIYAEMKIVELPGKSDDVFAFLSMNYFGVTTGLFFLLGITAAARFFPDLFNHFLQYRFFEDRSKGSFAKTPENRSTSGFFTIDVYRSNSFSGIE